MHLPVRLILCLFLLLPQTIRAEVTLQEAILFPQDLPREVTHQVLRARVWMHCIQKNAETLPARRDLLAHFTTQDLPFACAVLSDLTIEEIETETALTVRVTCNQSKDWQDRMRLLLSNPDLLWCFKELSLEIHNLLRLTDQYWPHARIYTEVRTNDQPLPSISKPNSTQAWLSLARQLMALTDAETALLPQEGGWMTTAQEMDKLEACHKAAPNNHFVLMLLAEARLRNSLPQLCIEDCTKILQQAPDLHRPRYLRALAHWQMQEFALAENDLSVVLAELNMAQNATEALQYLRARGAVRMLRGQYSAMCADFNLACTHGDCDGLKHARHNQHCLEFTLPKGENF